MVFHSVVYPVLHCPGYDLGVEHRGLFPAVYCSITWGRRRGDMGRREGSRTGLVSQASSIIPV